MYRLFYVVLLALSFQFSFSQTEKTPFQALDVFELEWASDPQISPNGTQIVYKRNGFDIMTDEPKGNLWIINADGTSHRKLTTREVNESQPRWSPSGDRIAFTSTTEAGSELYMYWVNTGQIAKLSQLEKSPASLTWSPDGKHLAFTMFVPQEAPVIIKMPAKPNPPPGRIDPSDPDPLPEPTAAPGAGFFNTSTADLIAATMAVTGASVRCSTAAHTGTSSSS